MLQDTVRKQFTNKHNRKKKTFICVSKIVVIRMDKSIFPCLFIVHNIISLSRHEQVCLMRLHLESYCSHHQAVVGEASLET